MIANKKFLNQPLEFWAYVRLASQRLGYYHQDEGEITPDADDNTSQLIVETTTEKPTEIKSEAETFAETVKFTDVLGALTKAKTRVSVKYRANHDIPGLSFDESSKELIVEGPLNSDHEQRLLAGDNRKGWADTVRKLCELSRDIPRIDVRELINDGKPSPLGELVTDYLNFRLHFLKTIEANLMDREEAKSHFEKLLAEHNPTCTLPKNKQKKEKQHYAYLTCIINILTQLNLQGEQFDDNPRGLATLTKNGKLFRTLSRWLDGAYPSTNDPKAVWEIKEYYGTTTFGSRVADGVYESMLDGFEFAELSSKGLHVNHYLIVDDRFTWWVKGKSYLCRLVDILHMGLVDEILFGREVLSRWPQIVATWNTKK